jgi:uncharacterized protein YkwD
MAWRLSSSFRRIGFLKKVDTAVDEPDIHMGGRYIIMRQFQIPITVLLALTLCACGGGGGSSAPALVSPAAVSAAPAAGEASRLGPGGNASPAIHGHFDRLNEIRTAMGLPGLDWSDTLATAAQRHAAYQTLNQQLGHNETAGRPGFSGEGFGARDSAAGYSGSLVSEVIIGGIPDTAQDGRNLLDAMLTAPGHRFVMLAWEFSEIGIGSAPMTSNLGTRMNRNAPVDGVLTYPYNGQANLPLGYSPASEMPNPLPGVAITGMPLSVHGSMFSSFLVTRASLFNNTANLTQDLIPGDSTAGARSAFVFFPKNALAAASSYTFCVDVQVNGKLRQLRSTFTTAPA